MSGTLIIIENLFYYFNGFVYRKVLTRSCFSTLFRSRPKQLSTRVSHKMLPPVAWTSGPPNVFFFPCVKTNGWSLDEIRREALTSAFLTPVRHRLMSLKCRRSIMRISIGVLGFCHSLFRNGLPRLSSWCTSVRPRVTFSGTVSLAPYSSQLLCTNVDRSTVRIMRRTFGFRA